MDDTKDTKDIKETGEAASVLSADEQMIQDGFNARRSETAFRRTLYNASYRRGSYRVPGDGFGLYLYLLCAIA